MEDIMEVLDLKDEEYERLKHADEYSFDNCSSEDENMSAYDLPPGWNDKTETAKSKYIKKLLDKFYSEVTSPINEALLQRQKISQEEVRDIKRTCQYYEEEFINVMKQRSKYFFHINFKDTKHLMRQLEYVWLKTEGKDVISPVIKVVVLDMFSTQRLYSTKKGKTVMYNEQKDINRTLQKYYTETAELLKICNQLENFGGELNAIHAKAASIKIMHEWCESKKCSEETASPFIQASIYTIEKKLFELDNSNSKTLQQVIQSITHELGNFQRMFQHPSITVIWSKIGNQTTWNEDPSKRRKNILDQLHNQSYRLKRYSGIHLIPPVYARCNGKLTKFTYKPGNTSNSKPKFIHTTKISRNIHKATEHLHTSYDFSIQCSKDVAQVLTDKNIIYVLLVIFPKFELSSKRRSGYQVQAFVGSAKEGLMDAWFFKTGSHLQNAMDLLHYYKIHCKCTDDNHMNRDGSHRHYPPRHPPQLIDCLLLYARLKGYDTELYIVDKAKGSRDSNIDALLQEKKLKWIRSLTATDTQWGLNTTDEHTCYVIDFRHDSNPEEIVKQVEFLWKHQMRLPRKQAISNTVRTVISDVFGGCKPPYVIDGISTVRNSIDKRIRDLERLQSIYLSLTRKTTTYDKDKLENLASAVVSMWPKNLSSSVEMPPIVEAAIKDIEASVGKDKNKKADPNLILLRIHKQLVLLGAMFERKKLGIGWNNSPIDTWSSQATVRRDNILDALFWQTTSLKRMQIQQLIDFLPTVFAKFGDGLAQCVNKTIKASNGGHQAYSTKFDCVVLKDKNRHLRNINFLQSLYDKHKGPDSDKADYNATGLQNVEMLTDKRVIYILAVSFPKSSLNKNANNVQCYVGKAVKGLEDKWSKSHLKNAWNVLEYFKHNDPVCPHMPSPPNLVDCVLVYAKLMGYDMAVYIVDQLLVPKIRPQTVLNETMWNKILDEELEKKKNNWVRTIKADNMLYGLNAI